MLWRSRRTLSLLVCLLAAAAAGAAEPHLLRNVHDVPLPDPGSGFAPMASLDDGRVVFSAGDEEHGREPWVTDGTIGGTARLGDLCPGRCNGVTDTTAAAFGSMAGQVVAFSARSVEGAEAELWLTDGTVAGTRSLRPAIPNAVEGSNFRLVPVEGRLFAFVYRRVSTIAVRLDLWATDGTVPGTWRVAEKVDDLSGVVGGRLLYRSDGVYHSSDGSPAGTEAWDSVLPANARFTALGKDRAVLMAELTDGTVELWSTDGTEAGTHRFSVLTGHTPIVLTAADRMAFTIRGSFEELWSTDGTAGGTRKLAEAPNFGDEAALGTLLFVAREHEVWLSRDGGPLQPLAGSSCGEGCYPRDLVAFRAGALWLAHHSGTELWYSDGSASGTRRLATLCGLCDPALTSALSLDGGPRAVVTTSLNGDTVWITDGTVAGTQRLLTLPTEHSRPGPFVVTAGGLVFGADDGIHGRELWVTDGRPQGTRLLSDLNPTIRDGDAWPGGLFRHDDRVWFFARDAYGTGLWRTDGTAAGSERWTLLPGVIGGEPEAPDGGTVAPRFQLRHGNRLFLLTNDGFSTGHLLVIDLDTGALRDLGSVYLDPSMQPQGAIAGDRMVIATADFLVTSDGTVEGTAHLDYQLDALVALDGATALGAGRSLTAVGSSDGLWRTDGTAAGTELVLEVGDELGELPSRLVAAGGVVFFSAKDRFGSPRLWRSDGTAAGTRPVAGAPPGPTLLTPSGDRVFFVTAASQQLWFAEAGQELATYVDDLLGDEPLQIEAMMAFREGVLVVHTGGFYGPELAWSDGSEDSLRRVVDLVPGVRGAAPRGFVVDGGRAWFLAQEGSGLRLAVTDGTAAGTGFLSDGGWPVTIDEDTELAVLGDRLLFTGREDRTGREVWVLPLGDAPRPPAPPVPPPAPRGVQVNAERSEQITVFWNADLADALYYVVEARRWDRDDWVAVATESGSFGLVSGLDRGMPYDFRVRVVNGAGSSPPSEPVSALVHPSYHSCGGALELCPHGGRFRVRVFWHDQRTGTHGLGVPTALPGNDRSGTFWFFRAANVELIVKLLDGRPVNGHHWVFAGGLTDVEYWLTVSDLEGRLTRTYRHRPGDLCGFADAAALPAGGAFSTVAPAQAPASLAAEGSSLLLLDARYRVDVTWRNPRTGATGSGTAVEGSDNTGYFWFFDESNIELVVKVLDGRPVNGHRWVFYGGLTDLELDIRVEDLVSGVGRTYHKEPGDLCGGADTAAF